MAVKLMGSLSTMVINIQIDLYSADVNYPTGHLKNEPDLDFAKAIATSLKGSRPYPRCFGNE